MKHLGHLCWNNRHSSRWTKALLIRILASIHSLHFIKQRHITNLSSLLLLILICFLLLFLLLLIYLNIGFYGILMLFYFLHILLLRLHLIYLLRLRLHVLLILNAITKILRCLVGIDKWILKLNRYCLIYIRLSIREIWILNVLWVRHLWISLRVIKVGYLLYWILLIILVSLYLVIVKSLRWEIIYLRVLVLIKIKGITCEIITHHHL